MLKPTAPCPAHLEVLNELLGPDLDEQLVLAQLPLQQLLVGQLKSDFAGSRDADRHLELLQLPVCNSGGEERTGIYLLRGRLVAKSL